MDKDKDIPQHDSLKIRPAAIAGQFYAADPEELTIKLDHMLDQAESAGALDVGLEDSPAPFPKAYPKALIVPHAGHVYSGSCAASAYVKWKDSPIKQVIMLGPAHRMAVNGMATSSASHWQTPLGQVKIDKDAQRLAESLPFIKPDDGAHQQEHCLEVHLPFLQKILGDDFTLLPIAVGQAEIDQVREVLELLWGDHETGILISTDLSHFLPYDQCNRIDGKTAKAVEQFQWNAIGRYQACGRIPLGGLLSLPVLGKTAAITKQSFVIERLGLINSGDRVGSKDRVVGYGAWAIYESAEAAAHIAPKTAHIAPTAGELTDQERADIELVAKYGQALLRLSQQALHLAVQQGRLVKPRHDGLNAKLLEARAVFVTYEKQFQLRGCIGSLQAHRPLVDDICANSIAAALKDPRFPPIAEHELKDIQISLSLLGKPEPMAFNDQADLLRQIQPFKDGLILEDAGKRATYLPQVWEQIPTAEAFLASLKQKAGLPADHWSDQIKIMRYRATKIA